jgi:putative DNA primase/helicase
VLDPEFLRDDDENETTSFGIGEKDDFKQAQWLAIKLKNEWRYDHTTTKWHHWDGFRWAPDETNQISHTVALVAAKAMLAGNAHVPKDTLAKLLNMQPQKRALEALATFPGYGTNGDDWDSDPFLLGVRNGIVDLRKNALVPNPSPDMLVTKTTGVKFKPVTDPSEFRERAPRFMEVMDEWMSGDAEMVAFLLRWFGAGLFGFSPEQRFLLMTGIGRNGKGALKHAVMCAVGEYAAQFDSNLYMRSKFGAARSDAARADLVALKGKRITFFSEPEGGHFNEELLKAHTGGDKIAARALYSNNIQTWDPTHSITFLVNDAPEVDDLGPSMGARVMVADFRERFDGEREDKTLYDTLKTEREGILAILCWAAASWYKRYEETHQGIPQPERVREQSQKFMERNDPVAAFIDEACNTGPALRGNSRLLYDAYVEWHRYSARDGEPMSNVKFSATLEKKGFRRVKTMSANVWTGIKPKGALELAYDDED